MKKIENRCQAEQELTISSMKEATGFIYTSFTSGTDTQEAPNTRVSDSMNGRRKDTYEWLEREELE